VKQFVKKLLPNGLYKTIEPYGHLLEAVFLHAINGFPARGLKVIGVTGTNGKTSTSFMIHRMLTDAGINTGLMTTVAYGINDDIRPQTFHMTNVPVRELIRQLKWMKGQGVDWIVLESASHGLAQNRLWSVPFSVAVFTNLTHEHLDYHGTFERYRDAKRRLFKMTNANTGGLKTGIINAEDPNADYFISDVANVVTYGVKAGDLRARNIKLASNGSRYQATIGSDTYYIDCRLPGSFNVFNSLAAVGVGRTLGLTKAQIEKGIAALVHVEGRMDPIDEGQDFNVIVDFAHTPDSFEKVFKDVKPHVKGKLIVLFGSPGRRDEAKRAIQGRLAGEYADEVIITEDDHRDIDGDEIMNMIAGGAEQAGKTRKKDLFLILDRTEAIEFAVSRASKGDMILFLGKGHEKSIQRADGEHPWDEVATVRAALRSRKQQ